MPPYTIAASAIINRWESLI